MNFELTVAEILKVKRQCLKIQIPIATRLRIFLQNFRLTALNITSKSENV